MVLKIYREFYVLCSHFKKLYRPAGTASTGTPSVNLVREKGLRSSYTEHSNYDLPHLTQKYGEVRHRQKHFARTIADL